MMNLQLKQNLKKEALQTWNTLHKLCPRDPELAIAKRALGVSVGGGGEGVLRSSADTVLDAVDLNTTRDISSPEDDFRGTSPPV